MTNAIQTGKKRSARLAWAGAGVLLLMAALAWGTWHFTWQPSAPPLLPANTEYVSDVAGLQFTPPVGWNERSRSNLTEITEKEHLLVRYKLVYARYPTFFRVSVSNLPQSASLTEYMARPIKGETWTQSSQIEDTTVHGLPALRADFAGQWDEHGVVKEVTAVRRGERVYLFTAIFPPNDPKSRRETRAAIDSVRWIE